MIKKSIGKPEINITVTGLEKIFFYYRLGMQKNWIEANTIFLRYIGSKFGQSMKASLLDRELVVTKVNKGLLRKFKTKDEQTIYLSTFEFWQQEEYKVAKDNY